MRTEGMSSLSCQVEPGADPTLELGARLQAAAIAVQELKLELPTLEEYFYSITDGLDHRAEQEAEPEAGLGTEQEAEDAPVAAESEGEDSTGGAQ